jgi:hypothetical protein
MSNPHPLSSVKVTVMKKSDLMKCRFFILVPEHYRGDGSCRCNEREHRDYMIRNWGYSEKDFDGIPLEGK